MPRVGTQPRPLPGPASALSGPAFMSLELWSLVQRNDLTSLSLRRRQLGASQVLGLAAALAGNNSLTSLDLRHNGLAAACASLARALIKNTTLLSLDVGSNDLTGVAVAALAAALESNRSLTYLRLARNPILAEGVQPLASALERGATALKRLALEGCKLGDSGVGRIAAALEGNSCLTILEIGANHTCSESAHALGKLLQRNSTLKKLDFRFGEMSFACVLCPR